MVETFYVILWKYTLQHCKRRRHWKRLRNRFDTISYWLFYDGGRYHIETSPLLRKSMDWFLYDNGLSHERVANGYALVSANHLHKTKTTFFTAQKMKFSIKDFFSKCDQIRSLQQIWSYFLKKSLMENFIFCAVFNNLSLVINRLTCQYENFMLISNFNMTVENSNF